MALGGSRADPYHQHHHMGNKIPVSPNMTTDSQNVAPPKKKGRIDVKDVFNNDDDDDTTNSVKKRKLVPLGMLRVKYSFYSKSLTYL